MTAFRDIRRKDRALTEAQAREILARAEHGVLATLGADGWPYAVPVNHVLADSDDVDQSFRSHADQIGAKRRRALSV